VLRKLIAVWIFQMTFCAFILTDAADNTLSDEEEINDRTWGSLKLDALKPDYTKETFF